MLKTTAVHEQRSLTSNQQTTMQIPVYGKIYSLALQFLLSTGAVASVAQIKAQIGQIRLTINGKDIINCTATQLFDVYSALGNYVQNPAGTAGALELNLGRLIFDSPAVRDAFGLGTANVANIQVSVTAGTIAANPNDIVSVQAFTARTSQVENLGIYCKLINYPQNFNSTGISVCDTLPRDPDSAYLAVLVDDGASGTITFGECKVNNNTIIELMPSAVNALFNAENRLAQPAGYFMYGFTDGEPTSLLPMSGVTDLRFNTTFSVAPGAAGYNALALTVAGLPVAKG